MGDQQRQWSRHRPLEVLVGVDGEHAVDVEHGVDLDVDDPRVRVRAAHHRDVHGVGTQVVGVAAAASQQPVVVDPWHPFAEQLGGHPASPDSAVAALRSSAARSTDFTMFW